ncbi:MAG: hypothetical protein Edafosvirus4_43 [Edafosvirus sp.]|uniref:Uncharacterized protein n=1 Tax=Edafosvirus sp. TaxID=2487765 RepID=A0A3G4ZX99_9VIRU|nr:MAG: hypothetical protein Edafosvirus4_43 [Edafosvirus sp.]
MSSEYGSYEDLNNCFSNPVVILALLLLLCVMILVIAWMIDGSIICGKPKCNECFDTNDQCIDNGDDAVITKYYAIGKNDDALYVKNNLDDATWTLVDNTNKYNSFVRDLKNTYISVFADGKTRIKPSFADQWQIPDPNDNIGRYMKPDGGNLAYGLNKYTAVGPSSELRTRTGFTGNWTTQVINPVRITEVMYDNIKKNMVGINDNGNVYTSNINFPMEWIMINNGDIPIASITMDNGVYYAVGQDGQLYSKPDLTARWNKYKTESNIPLKYINFFKGRKVPL